MTKDRQLDRIYDVCANCFRSTEPDINNDMVLKDSSRRTGDNNDCLRVVKDNSGSLLWLLACDGRFTDEMLGALLVPWNEWEVRSRRR